MGSEVSQDQWVKYEFDAQVSRTGSSYTAVAVELAVVDAEMLLGHALVKCPLFRSKAHGGEPKYARSTCTATGSGSIPFAASSVRQNVGAPHLPPIPRRETPTCVELCPHRGHTHVRDRSQPVILSYESGLISPGRRESSR